MEFECFIVARFSEKTNSGVVFQMRFSRKTSIFFFLIKFCGKEPWKLIGILVQFYVGSRVLDAKI